MPCLFSFSIFSRGCKQLKSLHVVSWCKVNYFLGNNCMFMRLFIVTRWKFEFTRSIVTAQPRSKAKMLFYEERVVLAQSFFSSIPWNISSVRWNLHSSLWNGKTIGKALNIFKDIHFLGYRGNKLFVCDKQIARVWLIIPCTHYFIHLSAVAQLVAHSVVNKAWRQEQQI